MNVNQHGSEPIYHDAIRVQRGSRIISMKEKSFILINLSSYESDLCVPRVSLNDVVFK